MIRKEKAFAADDMNPFSARAGEWWDSEGAFRILHRMNPLRTAYVRDQVCVCLGRKADLSKPLKGLSLLDVGCGGGLLAESLACLGARVTGFDVSAKAIAVARQHARKTGQKITYRTGRIEDIAGNKTCYDIVTAFEILEHIKQPDVFLEAVMDVLKPGGVLVLATLNRTVPAFLLGVVAAEYVLGWVPRGTHTWGQFMRPSELVRRLGVLGAETRDVTGMAFNPLSGEFGLKKGCTSINYVLTAVKKGG